MTTHTRWTRPVGLALALTGVALAAEHAGSLQAGAVQASDATGDTGGKQARVAFVHALPRLEGSRLKATVVEVRYGPGESSPAHSHPCPVIGYVVQGALRTQAAGESVAVYHAGEAFYEAPNQVHQVSANASQTDSVRFLAYFTCDRDTPLSVPAPKNH
jgi:quercetin dioxygenase-like cupin family protein